MDTPLVLHVDVDVDLVDAVTSRLRACGFRVTTALDGVLLTQKALQKGKIFNSLSVAQDGVEALEFVRREGRIKDSPRPDLILLDLNMPRKDGRETLAEIKKDASLNSIPVVVLTTSDADHDVIQGYDMQASCYITKPVDVVKFTGVIQALQEFWLCVVKLPSKAAKSLL